MALLTIKGRVVHMPGYWGTGLPLRGARVRIYDIDQPGLGDDLIWEGVTDRRGEFGGRSKEWDDSLTGRIPNTALPGGRLPIRQPSGRGTQAPKDVLLLQAHIVHNGQETRLPFTYINDSTASPDLVVPWGPVRQRVVKISPAKPGAPGKALKKDELRTLVNRPGTHVITNRSGEANRKASQAARRQNLKDFEKIYANRRPDLVKYVRELAQKDEVDNEPVVTVKGKGGKERKYKLLHGLSMVREAVLARRALSDPAHQARAYTKLYEMSMAQTKALPAAERDKARKALQKYDPQARVPAPYPTQSAPIDAVMLELANLVVDLFFKYPTGDPSKKPATCGGEEGSGFGGDATPGNPAVTLNPQGLLQNNNWALKPYTTCVRDQGARGACTAFGIVGATEALAAYLYGRWTNLSEQDLYMHQKLYWFPALDYYGDGYNAVYSVLLQAISGLYVFPYERDWDYNQSRSRVENDATRTYTDSCDNYSGEACSDTNHQAAIACYTIQTKEVKEVVTETCTWVETVVSSIPVIGGFVSEVIGEWVCEPVTELIETIAEQQVCIYETVIPGSSGLRIDDGIFFWDPFFGSQVALAKAYLANYKPVVFCFYVPPSFGQATNNGGYVSYNSAEEFNLEMGSHCALITGYVDNADRPAGAPAAAGGGYFVLKNSWGSDWGDGGFAYLPVDWVTRWGTGMIAVTDVED